VEHLDLSWSPQAHYRQNDFTLVFQSTRARTGTCKLACLGQSIFRHRSRTSTWNSRLLFFASHCRRSSGVCSTEAQAVDKTCERDITKLGCLFVSDCPIGSLAGVVCREYQWICLDLVWHNGRRLLEINRSSYWLGTE